MKKNSCPHCGAWGQFSRFCNRCGKTLIYSSVREGQQEFADKPIVNSTAKRDIPVVLFASTLLTLAVVIILVGIFDLLD